MPFNSEVDTRVLQRFEQQLPVFRATYDESTPEERKELRERLARLVAAGEGLEQFSMIVKVHADRIIHDNEGDIVEEGHAQLTPNVMLKAMDTWDKGEVFTPGALGTF